MAARTFTDAIVQPSIVQKIVAVCGSHGCVQVQNKRVIHQQSRATPAHTTFEREMARQARAARHA
jgi:hypothetical protein